MDPESISCLNQYYKSWVEWQLFVTQLCHTRHGNQFWDQVRIRHQKGISDVTWDCGKGNSNSTCWLPKTVKMSNTLDQKPRTFGTLNNILSLTAIWMDISGCPRVIFVQLKTSTSWNGRRCARCVFVSGEASFTLYQRHAGGGWIIWEITNADE